MSDTPQTPPRVLLVEDIPSALAFYELTLEHAGYCVEGAQTGADAMLLLEKNQYDIILLDEYLPDMDGSDLYNRYHLRCLEQNLTPAPTIIITADIHEIIAKYKTLPVQPAGILAKPLTAEEILQYVMQVIKGFGANNLPITRDDNYTKTAEYFSHRFPDAKSGYYNNLVEMQQLAKNLYQAFMNQEADAYHKVHHKMVGLSSILQAAPILAVLHTIPEAHQTSVASIEELNDSIRLYFDNLKTYLPPENTL